MNRQLTHKNVGRSLLCWLALCHSFSAFAQSVPEKAPNPKDQVVELSPFAVSALRDRGYGASQSLGASRVALPLSEIPSSVITLNEQFFADRAAIDGMEVLSFVSGVQRGSDSLPGQTAYTLRGYAVTGLNLRDGLPDPVEAADLGLDESSDYERLEILKGPAGTLYGSTSMGGVVNKISKWPSFNRRSTKFEFQAQSYEEFIRAMVDSTGPINDRTAYRFVVSSRRGNRFYDEKDAPLDMDNVLLALTHRIGGADERGGRVWGRMRYLGYEIDRQGGDQFLTGYLDGRNPTAPGLVQSKNPKIPVERETNTMPEDDISIGHSASLELGYEKTWRNASIGDWTVRLIGRDNRSPGDKSPDYAQATPVPVDSAGQRVTYTNASGAQVAGDARFISADDPRVADWRNTVQVRDFAGYNDRSGVFLDLVGKFATGPLKHILVVNGQRTWGESERAFFFWNLTNPSNTTALANSFSAVRPDYSRYNRAALWATTPSFNSFNGHTEFGNDAIGFQNNVSMLGDRLIVVVGARYDKSDSELYRFNSAQSIAQRRFVPDLATFAKNTNSDSTYKYGLVGKPIPGVSIFAQLATTFNPVSSINPITGAANPNQNGETREAGVKLDLLENRLTATFSVFKMELTNVLVSVPNPPELGGGTVSVPRGTQRTDGWELDLAWQPFTGVSLSAGYSDLKSKDELDRWFRGVPRDPTYSLVAKYDFVAGRAKGLFLGASWKHVGSFAGEANNTFFVTESDMVDAFFGYGRNAWGVQLNVFNLLDTDAVQSTVSPLIISRAKPRMYRVTLRYQF